MEQPYAFPEARIVDIHEIKPKPSLTRFEFILALCLIFAGIIWMLTMLGGSPVTTASGWAFFFMTIIPMAVLMASGIWIIKRKGIPMFEEDKYIDAYLGKDTLKSMRKLLREDI